MSYLHLGGEVTISSREVLAIIDLVQEENHATTEFLALARAEGQVEVIGDQPKTMVITTGKKIYLTPISSLTLWRRSLAPDLSGEAGGFLRDGDRFVPIQA